MAAAGSQAPSAAGAPAVHTGGTATAPSACRTEFEQCWSKTKDIRACATKAQPCGLFPDGPDAAAACYDTMTNCFALTGFDYPECIGRAEDCGLLREGARECAVVLERCMLTGPLEVIPKCFEDATNCGSISRGGRVLSRSSWRSSPPIEQS